MCWLVQGTLSGFVKGDTKSLDYSQLRPVCSFTPICPKTPESQFRFLRPHTEALFSKPDNPTLHKPSRNLNPQPLTSNREASTKSRKRYL